jgi:hypothetical protein
MRIKTRVENNGISQSLTSSLSLMVVVVVVVVVVVLELLSSFSPDVVGGADMVAGLPFCLCRRYWLLITP